MARIEKRPTGKGFSYRVAIRKKNNEIFKTFTTEEDANLFVFYKEKLMENMDNFDVPLDKRLTLRQVFELKIESVKNSSASKSGTADFEDAYSRISPYITDDKFLCEYSFDDWLKATKALYDTFVYRGAKKEHTKRPMSILTLRRHIASASSAFSFANAQGITLDNWPMKVMQTFINPLVKEHKEKLKDES